MNPERRKFLQYSLAGIAAAATPSATAAWFNPCHSRLPEALLRHPLIQSAWNGINSAEVWDTHAHIAGTGDAATGIYHTHEMESLWHPIQYLQHKFYLNAGCTERGRVDASYVERMSRLMQEMQQITAVPDMHNQPGAKLMLFAFEQGYDEQGNLHKDKTAFHVPNEVAREVTQSNQKYFEWVCSIHPCRKDAVDELEKCVAQGARAVKWLPSAMGIVPDADKCDDFYRALAKHNIPLITHAGEEKAVDGMGLHQANNPLRFRKAMDMGVRVVIAHCASIGEDVDLDKGEHGPHVPSFELFTRLMEQSEYKGRLFGDISAIVLRNRKPEVVRAIIEHEDWHARLLNGSDYPLVGVLPLFKLKRFVQEGMLDEAVVPVLEEIQQYNPLLFDFVLKRSLKSGDHRLSNNIFMTKSFFQSSSVR